MSENLNNYIQWGWQRREELMPLIYERTNGQVYQGPFTGMIIKQRYSWGDGDTASKLLGIYECELHPVIETELSVNHDLILNLGCAEGYYGLGMALRLPSVLCALFDISETAINICRENANINNIHNVHFNKDCSPENIRSYLSKYSNPFVIMDIEGHERILLDYDVIPELSKCSVLIESHDCIIPGTTQLITERFKDTHEVKIISQGNKNPYIEILNDLCDADKMLLCCEYRPSTMYWIWLRPKQI